MNRWTIMACKVRQVSWTMWGGQVMCGYVLQEEGSSEVD
jgi:hypothetical protein